MRVRSEAFRLWKAGNAPEEYEDACWPEDAAVREVRVFRCAVADGATETSFAASWARLLVRAYCRGELSPRKFSACLAVLESRWRKDAYARPLPWYAEQKVRSGAFSSILGLTLYAKDGSVSWHATAIGDSCLFHVRGDNLITAFPLIDSHAFNNRPYLLSSNMSSTATMREHRSDFAGVAQMGDTFFLMTDALAHWFLREHEKGGQPSTRLQCSESFDGRPFETWIGHLRETKILRNDDVTLLRVQLV